MMFTFCIAWIAGNNNERIPSIRLPISLNQIVIIRMVISCAYYLIFFISVLGSYGIWISSDISNSQFWKMSLHLFALLIFSSGLIIIGVDLARIWAHTKIKWIGLSIVLFTAIPSSVCAVILTMTPKSSASNFHTIIELQHQLSDTSLALILAFLGIILFYASTITYKHRKSYIR
ncbi:MAG: hypothetical protein ACO36I_15790 [Candidatus Latescibacterota bacterium]